MIFDFLFFMQKTFYEMEKKFVYKRNLYLKKIIPLMDAPVIKVIAGMRRAGKSCLMKLIIDELSERQADARQIVYINKEYPEYDFIKDYKSLEFRYPNFRFIRVRLIS